VSVDICVAIDDLRWHTALHIKKSLDDGAKVEWRFPRIDWMM
jgi:hypothetical protein